MRRRTLPLHRRPDRRPLAEKLASAATATALTGLPAEIEVSRKEARELERSLARFEKREDT